MDRAFAVHAHNIAIGLLDQRDQRVPHNSHDYHCAQIGGWQIRFAQSHDATTSAMLELIQLNVKLNNNCIYPCFQHNHIESEDFELTCSSQPSSASTDHNHAELLVQLAFFIKK